MKIFKKKVRGFTIIELLVVIAIIGVLSVVVMSSFNVARKKGRVAKRVSDMKQVQAALEFYYSANHAYPSSGGAWTSCPASASAANTMIGGSPAFTPTFISVVPVDPQWTAGLSSNCYTYKSDGTDYAFKDVADEMAASQSGPNISTYPELVDPASNTTAWKVYSSGASGW